MSSALFRRAANVTATTARSFSTTSPRSVARISIIGNLVDTPELQTTSSGRTLVRYAVASNSGPKDNRQVSFFRVASFADGGRRDYLLSLAKGYVSDPGGLSVYGKFFGDCVLTCGR